MANNIILWHIVMNRFMKVINFLILMDEIVILEKLYRFSSSHPVWNSSKCCGCQRCTSGCSTIRWTSCYSCRVNSDIVFLEWRFYFWYFSRDAMFMMVAVSWTFSSQSRLKLSLRNFIVCISFGNKKIKSHFETRYGIKTYPLGPILLWSFAGSFHATNFFQSFLLLHYFFRSMFDSC
jgi:hypothetical protein